jgi:hypothetical protein
VGERFRCRYILQIAAAKLQTANVSYFQRKIQLSGIFREKSNYPVFSKKSPIIRYFQRKIQLSGVFKKIQLSGFFFLSGWLAVTINPDKWNFIVCGTEISGS